MNREKLYVLLLLLLTIGTPAFADEGMYPISELQKLNLEAKGLKIAAADIFNPNKTSLIDGVCRVNGCTGSFVSPDGLIITNHHCAYRAIQSASTADNDLLKNGFQAKTRGDEIPARGYTVRVTESYQDVSDDVLAIVSKDLTYSERTKAIDKRRKELEKAAEEKNPGRRAEVAEMFIGKTYVLFMYTYIKDVRLVFAPPASVGNFGGDVDNWEWPRHTGDFSFMRAYVAADGSTAEYSRDNVPFKPKRFIQVAKQGVSDGDFVFLLGYPGRTARHKTAGFLTYEEKVRLPAVIDLYQWQLNTMEDSGKDDRAIMLKHLSRMRSLANVEKRSRGQLKGLTRANIVQTRAAAEAKLQAFIDADPDRQAKYGNLLKDINSVYAEMTQTAPFEFNFQNMRSASRLMGIAFTIYDAAVERQKDDLERETPYMDRNWDQTVQRMMLGQRDVHVPTDEKMMAEMIHRVMKNVGSRNLPYLNEVVGGDLEKPDEFATYLYSKTKLGDIDAVKANLKKTPTELAESDDPMIRLVVALYPVYKELREKNKERDGRLGELYGSLIDVKKEFLKTNFVPDANATLRLTFGYVRGYSPEDAVWKSPITTLKGVVDKTTGAPPFVTPQKVLDKYKAKDFGSFVHPKLNQVPVAILYSTDTTGGNSGSPIFNAKGELVGVNFDRAFEATINDFAWNESYSRSIGVDVRYALWITGKVFGADHLLKEMGVE